VPVDVDIRRIQPWRCSLDLDVILIPIYGPELTMVRLLFVSIVYVDMSPVLGRIQVLRVLHLIHRLNNGPT
jgi:hypothetical protein